MSRKVKMEKGSFSQFWAVTMFSPPPGGTPRLRRNIKPYKLAPIQREMFIQEAIGWGINDWALIFLKFFAIDLINQATIFMSHFCSLVTRHSTVVVLNTLPFPPFWSMNLSTSLLQVANCHLINHPLTVALPCPCSLWQMIEAKIGKSWVRYNIMTFLITLLELFLT